MDFTGKAIIDFQWQDQITLKKRAIWAFRKGGVASGKWRVGA